MAYQIEKGTGDLVFSGFEEGIADAPEKGIAMMRNINLVSIPGEACVNFATQAVTVPAVGITASSVTFTASNDTVSWVSGGTTLYTGEAVKFGTSSGGVTAGVIYYMGNVVNGSTATFKVYTDIGHTQLVDLSADGSNTMTVPSFGQATQKAIDTVNGLVFFLDSAGLVWWVDASGNLVYIANTTLTNAHGNGLVIQNDSTNTGFLYVFRDTKIDYFPTTYLTSTSAPASGWTYDWKTITSNTNHYALSAQDNGMYFCNNQTVGSILATSGNNSIDPATSSTFTFNASALLLPSVDRANCLAELGTFLMVGGTQNKIYPWDRISTSFNYPIIVAENLITRMVTTNSSTYVFAGNRGRIYVTNGSNIQLFKKVPDHITGYTDPYFTWLDAIYWKNQIYFSFLTAQNSGTAIATLGGVWALDISMSQLGSENAVCLRQSNTLAGGVNCYPYAIAPNVRTATPAGAGLYIAWANATAGTYGVDVTSSTPYSDYSAPTVTPVGEIYTDLVPLGTLLGPKTFTQIEWKLAEELVAGEAVRISYRQSYSQSWTTVSSTTYAANTLSDVYAVNFQNGQWLQLYIELQSTSTTPSYNRLQQVRIR